MGSNEAAGSVNVARSNSAYSNSGHGQDPPTFSSAGFGGSSTGGQRRVSSSSIGSGAGDGGGMSSSDATTQEMLVPTQSFTQPYSTASANPSSTSLLPPTRSPSTAFDFPVLPPPTLDPNQTVQTPTQVQSILSLPPSLLLHLARTSSHSEQKQIAQRANATPYLNAMTLPPPSPTHLVKGFADLTPVGRSITSFTQIGDHPAIPLLLGQVFSPPTPGITVPYSATSTSGKEFRPTFASVEDWSRKVARERFNLQTTVTPTTIIPSTSSSSSTTRPPLNSSHSFSEREIDSIADQLKTWALTEEVTGINRQVTSSKEAAVVLASQVSARSRLVAAANHAVRTSEALAASSSSSSNTTMSIHPAVIAKARTVLEGGEAGKEVESTLKTMDLTPYSEPFKIQLAALASGYFAQLHREGFNRLLAASSGVDYSPPPLGDPPSSSSSFPSPHQRGAMNVRAAASAAIAANVLAANEMAMEAGITLTNMGVDVPKLVPGKKTGGLEALEVSVGALAIDALAVSTETTGGVRVMREKIVPTTNQQRSGAVPTSVEAEVTKILGDVNGVNGCTPEKRDYLLGYAHTLYSSDPTNEHLLPLLHTLEQAHPRHLPTLLLMSCVYYSRGELQSSLFYNDKLLQYDPNYVEAMSNIGTTLRAMGRWKEAETWWWKAITLRPTYWDATENLLGVLCNPSSTAKLSPTIPGIDPPPTTPRFSEALILCDHVDSRIFLPHISSSTPTNHDAELVQSIPRPRLLPGTISISHVHRLQNLFYAKGNLKLAVGDSLAALDEFQKAVEIVLSLPAWVRDRATPDQVAYPIEGATVRDLVVVAHIIGSLLAVYNQFGGQPNQYTAAEVERLGVGDVDRNVRFEELFAKVQNGGDAYVVSLLGPGSLLPTVLLQPEDLPRLLQMLFPDTSGLLPAMLKTSTSNSEQQAAHAQAVQLTSQTTSTMLLTIAKILQDFLANPTTAQGVTLDRIPISPSLLLPLYYVALALHPSPSTCNNLGILLSTMNSTTLIAERPGAQPVLYNGQHLALRFYRAGLALDPKHPHLYTNLGSLLKDMGNLPQAVQMYRQAVEFNPTFDVALANLANAIKDTGNIQDSIPFYRRAVAVNPTFPEAICGLVNALGGVCDWLGRGGVNEPWTVDNSGNIVAAPLPDRPGAVARSGYLGQISELVAKQLNDGQQYGAGVVAASGGLEDWLTVISQSIYNLPTEAIGAAADTWAFRISSLLSVSDRADWPINEGGFVIRLIERLMRRIQRRWYLTSYGKVESSTIALPRIAVSETDIATYRRPVVPPSLPAPTVPTVLPFHVFTYPVSARETRLISHRTGLRISHSTLTQPWLPPHVYPPPPPPENGKLNIGYVSSDLGNHPLSHLMQSVFGFHNLSQFTVFCYATSPSDNSPYRQKIEAEAQNFLDVSGYSTQQIVDRIVSDKIHILVNLSGYTKGAKNEVFACRPAPIQMSYMGFAGTLSAGWCDYFVVDPIVCPPALVSGNQWRQRQGYAGDAVDAEGDGPTDFDGDPDPEGPSDDFVYTEKLIYLPHSYFVTDHKQAWFVDEPPTPAGFVLIANDGTPEKIWAIEEDRRWQMRKAMFPTMRDDTIIFANWNQLYKIDPFIFRIWLNILAKHRNSVLWLLRFPAPGEQHLIDMARRWAGDEVASRVIFTDVTNKNEHIRRGRIPDLFLDTTECNAHTTACDALAQGTPLVTWPRHLHKMCSRVATSVVLATGFGTQMIVRSEEEYEARALALAGSLTYDMVPPLLGARAEDLESRVQRRGRGELSELRKSLFLTRDQSPLFDTRRWVINMEKGYVEAWKRWVGGTEFEDAGEWYDAGDNIRRSGCIWISDDVDGLNLRTREPYFD